MKLSFNLGGGVCYCFFLNNSIECGTLITFCIGLGIPETDEGWFSYDEVKQTWQTFSVVDSNWQVFSVLW